MKELVVYWKELKEDMVKNKRHENKSSLKASRSTLLRYSDVPVMNVNVGTSLWVCCKS